MDTVRDIPALLRAANQELGELERRVKWTDEAITDLMTLRAEWAAKMEAKRGEADRLRRGLFGSFN
jgi:hypothetical protein